MSENRRDAWRIQHSGVGWLAARGFRAICTVEDISVSGARVRLTRTRMSKPQPLPEQLTLTTVVGGDQVTVPGKVTRIDRGEGGVLVGLHFNNGDAVNLGWLINQAQREEINRAKGEPLHSPPSAA